MTKARHVAFLHSWKKMTKAKKSCISAFGSCRKLEDSVSETLSACSPGNSETKGKNILKKGKINKLAVNSLLKKVNETINGKSTIDSNTTCGDFIIAMKKLNDFIINSPLNSKIYEIINKISNQTINI